MLGMGAVTTMFVLIAFLTALAVVIVRSVEAWSRVEIERERTRLKRVEVDLASIASAAKMVEGYPTPRAS
jgi:energy-converting hydrogenase Eha subunit H